MKKIVILSDNSGGSFSWVTLLNALFPECEIEIRMVSAVEEGLEPYLNKITIDAKRIRRGQQFQNFKASHRW